jgi:peptidoglycan/xylan/chitin deacetylase (PgdA/CDA1 family)
LPGCATVVTIDDGWYGTYKFMGPILKEHGFQATLYIASYYLNRPLKNSVIGPF